MAWRVSRVNGYGLLKSVDDATEAVVWENVQFSSDYAMPMNHPDEHNFSAGKVRADYVFGRMMKLNLSYTPITVTTPDHEPNPEYQSWYYRYKSYHDLVQAAIKSLQDEMVRAGN